MVWIDYAILGLVGLSAIAGLMRGLIREVISLAVLGAAVWMAMTYSGDLAVKLSLAIPVPSLRRAAAYLLIFVGSLMIGGLLGRGLGKLAKAGGLSGTDRLAGMLFGSARGLLVIAVLIWLAEMTALPKEDWWQRSTLIPTVQSLANWLKGQIPPDLAGHVKFPLD